jgi:hypothetical protein
MKGRDPKLPAVRSIAWLDDLSKISLGLYKPSLYGTPEKVVKEPATIDVEASGPQRHATCNAVTAVPGTEE